MHADCACEDDGYTFPSLSCLITRSILQSPHSLLTKLDWAVSTVFSLPTVLSDGLHDQTAPYTHYHTDPQVQCHSPVSRSVHMVCFVTPSHHLEEGYDF